MVPDHGRGGISQVLLIIHVEEMVGVGQQLQRVLIPADLAVDHGIAVAVDAEPAAEHMGFTQQVLQRPQQQRLFQLQRLRQGRGGGAFRRPPALPC